MARRPRKKRKSKRRKPRYWPPSVAWLEPGVLAQFRPKLVPSNENEWVVDRGISTWKSLEYLKQRFNFTRFNGQPPARIRSRLKIHEAICMIVDKRRLADNIVAVQVIHEDKIFWVLSGELCKPKDQNNDLETVS